MQCPDLATERICIITGEEGENPDDCTTHAHEDGLQYWCKECQNTKGKNGSMVIRIDKEMYALLEANAKGFETPNQVMRRLLGLDV